MSIKIRRYQANESDFSKDGRTRATLDIPSTVGFTDLTTSKLILDCHMRVQEGTTDVLLPATFGLNSQMVGGPQAIIRNTKVTSREYGLMNEQRNCNVVSANMDWYLRSRAAEDCDSLLGNSTNQNFGRGERSKLPDNPFIEYSRPKGTTTQATTSISRRAELPVPWRNIDEFGNIAQFPNLAVGSLDLQIEFENQFDVVSPCDMPARQIEPVDNIQLAGGDTDIGDATYPFVLTKPVSQFWKRPVAGELLTVWYDAASTGTGLDTVRIVSVSEVAGRFHLVVDAPINVTANDLVSQIKCVYYTAGCNAPLACDTITPTANEIGDATHPLVVVDAFSQNTAEAHKECPLYVGAPVVVLAMDSTGVRIFEDFVAELTINGTNLEVILDNPFNVGSNTQQTQVFIGYRDSLNNVKFTVNWVVDEVYAELHELQLLPSQREMARKALSNLQIPFVSMYLKQRVMPSTDTHSEVIQVDPNCLGLACLAPQNLTLLSGFDNCETYRWAINGKDQTNRDIVVGGEDDVNRQLHNYMLKRFFGNMSERLMKYDSPTLNVAAKNNKITHAMFPLVTPVVPEPQTVQLVLKAGSGSLMTGKNLFFVQVMAKTLVISNGRAMVM